MTKNLEIRRTGRGSAAYRAGPEGQRVGRDQRRIAEGAVELVCPCAALAGMPILGLLLLPWLNVSNF